MASKNKLLESQSFTNNIIPEAIGAAEHYFSLEKSIGAKRQELTQKYVGELLQKELQKLDDELRAAHARKREIVENSRTEMLERIAGTKTKRAEKALVESLDGAAVSPDYKLLELPVVLTDAELRTLFLRHETNPVFTRALQGYATKNRIIVDFTSAYDKATNAVHAVHNRLARFLSDKPNFALLQDNPRFASELDVQLTEALSSIAARA